MRRRLVAAAASLWLATPAAAQPAVDNFDALRVSAEITGLLARRELDAAAEMAARLMDGTSAAKLKGVFQLVNGLGQSQYADVVYARDYGRSEGQGVPVRSVSVSRRSRRLAVDPHPSEHGERAAVPQGLGAHLSEVTVFRGAQPIVRDPPGSNKMG
jgi:hypothetical protein